MSEPINRLNAALEGRYRVERPNLLSRIFTRDRSRWWLLQVRIA